MMWNDQKSLTFSKFAILAFMCLLLAAVLTAPWLIEKLLVFSRADLDGTKTFFLATVYIGTIPAAYLLISLLRLLQRLEAGQVFIPLNVEALRKISWSCFAGSAISLISVAYYFPWAFVAVAAAFMGLIVRVVKNVVAQAVNLQDEADYTV